MYKVEIGVFEENYFVNFEERAKRTFIPVFTEVVPTKEEMARKLKLFLQEKSWRSFDLEMFIHSEDRPCTIILGGAHHGYGYRVIELEESPKKETLIDVLKETFGGTKH